MGSTKPERSISSSIPMWMKTKMNDRYDIAEPFSPPAHDDNFFYIRYPKSTVQPTSVQQENTCRPIGDLDPDLTRHTAPCKQFMPQTKMSNDMPGISLTKAKKSQGTDDGFTGEAAACGQSVVQVAQQMVAQQLVAGKFDVQNLDSMLGAESYDFKKRRGSKSLPASPLATPDSSPRIVRKQTPNRYFTGAFAPTADNKTNQEVKYPGGWILAGFLGQREHMNLTIPEETKEDPGMSTSPKASLDVSTGMRRNKSTSVIGKLMAEETIDGAKVIRPKPSELREMNFWSPTSM